MAIKIICYEDIKICDLDFNKNSVILKKDDFYYIDSYSKNKRWYYVFDKNGDKIGVIDGNSEL